MANNNRSLGKRAALSFATLVGIAATAVLLVQLGRPCSLRQLAFSPISRSLLMIQIPKIASIFGLLLFLTRIGLAAWNSFRAELHLIGNGPIARPGILRRCVLRSPVALRLFAAVITILGFTTLINVSHRRSNFAECLYDIRLVGGEIECSDELELSNDFDWREFFFRKSTPPTTGFALSLPSLYVDASGSSLNGDQLATIARALRRLPNPASLKLGGARLRDDDLKCFSFVNNIGSVEIIDAPITEFGIACFAKLPDLSTIHVKNASISIAGVATLEDVPLDELEFDGRTVHSGRFANTRQPKRQRFRNSIKFDDNGKRVIGFKPFRVDIGCRIGPAPPTPISTVKLSNVEIGTKELVAVLSLPKLDRLILDHVSIKPRCFDAFQIVRSQIRLLSVIDTPVEDADVQNLADLTQLEELVLAKTRITGKCFAKFGSLEKLTLLHCTASAIGSERPLRYPSIPSVRDLDLSDNPLTDQDAEILESFPSVQELRLSRTKIADQGLAPLSKLADLKTVDLCETSVTGVGFSSHFSESTFETIDLSQSPVSDGGARAIARLPHLKDLNLHATRISDVGVSLLADSNGISILNISDTSISVYVVEILAQMKSLKEVSLKTKSGSYDEMGMLSRRRRDIKFFYESAYEDSEDW